MLVVLFPGGGWLLSAGSKCGVYVGWGLIVGWGGGVGVDPRGNKGWVIDHSHRLRHPDKLRPLTSSEFSSNALI